MPHRPPSARPGSRRPLLRLLPTSALACALALAEAHPGAASPLTATPTTYPVGSAPAAVVFADLNGDGKPDMVVPNTGSNTVTVYLATASGFGPRVDYATGTGPVAVAIADFDRDGIPDLAVANSKSTKLSVLRGTGAGAFAAKVDFAAANYASAIAAGDWNGDGKPDLVVANPLTGNVAVMLGNGNGGFGLPATYNTGGDFPSAVVAADLDRDGTLDLVVTNRSSDAVNVLQGDGAGGFWSMNPIATGPAPAALALADLNADGNPDLVVANSGGNSFSVLSGDGAGGFGGRTDYPTGLSPCAVTIGDLNADGRLDVAVANAGSASVSLLLGGIGGGFLASRTEIAAGTSPSGIALLWPSGGGVPAIVVSNGGGNSVTVLTGVNPTAIALESGTNPSRRGERVTYTARVTPPGATGTVQFMEGSRALAAAPAVLAGGVATWVDSTLAGGAHTLTAVYSGDAGHDGSASAPIVQTVVLGSTTTSLGASPNPGVSGEPVTLTATVVPSTVLGTVGFWDGATLLGTANTFQGVGAIAVSTLSRGDHAVTAVFNGSALDNASTSPPVVVTILDSGARVTTTTLVATPNPAYFGQSVTLAVSVDPPPTSGIVQIYDGGTILVGAGSIAQGTCSMTFGTLARGTHAFTAKFAARLGYQASQSPVVGLVVGNMRPTSTVLVSSPNPTVFGQGTTLTATVTPAGASGSVTFRNNSATLGTVALSGGTATFATTTLAVGPHSLVAAFTGSTMDTASTSPALPHVVNLAPTVTAIASGLPRAVYSETVSFTATVTVPAPGAGAVSDSVQFTVDGVNFGAGVPVSNGIATSQGTSALAAGDHQVRAHYHGSATLAASDAPVFTQAIRSPGPTIRRITDVPLDQGRFVRLEIVPSPFDTAGVNASRAIVRYSVYRHIDAAAAAARRVATPAGAQLADWEQVGGLDAYADAIYYAVAPTLVDSNAAGPHLATFFVRAATGSPSVYFDSPAVAGCSVDNLPPATPAPFRAVYTPAATQLHWGANGEADFAVYRLYRGASADFEPEQATLLAQLADTGYVDTGAGAAFYKLTALDFNGDESPCALVSPPTTSAPGDEVALAFALAGVRPNPGSGGALEVRFVLPVAAPARLELLDVSGRRVRALDVGALGAGRHAVDLLAGAPVAPGLYVVRLTQGASVRAVRAVVLR